MREQAWLGLMVLLGIALAFAVGHINGTHSVRSAIYVERYDGRTSYGPYIGRCIPGTDGISVYCSKEAE